MSSTQTFAGWPARVSRMSDIPVAFRVPFASLTQGVGPFPLALFSPEFKTQGYHEIPKLLIISGDRVTCFEDRAGRVDRTGLLLDDVHTVQCGTALLHSWIRLEASGSSGDSSIEVSFNTVGRELYRNVIESYRARLYGGSRVRSIASGPSSTSG